MSGGSGTGGVPSSTAGRRDGALAHYVPGLDGLRGFGMAWMLAYHLQATWASGAFFALSQFFTLSGFLITSVLLRAHARAGGTDLRRFWAQRFRRLLPAAYLTLAAVTLVGLVAPQLERTEDLGATVAACLAQVANWFFVVSDQSYVDLFTDPSPLQHFWSLAIEEQFYLAFPLVLAGLLRWGRSRWFVAGALGAMALASTATMVVLFERGASIDRLYYGTDTRAAEILVGCVLAVLVQARTPQLGPRGRLALGTAGTVAFAVTMYLVVTAHLTDGWAYQGGLFAFSILSAVLILSIVVGVGPVATFVAWAPLAAFGRMIYGTYLFHWPIFIWLDESSTGLEGLPLDALRLAVTFAAALASYHLVEMPIRNGALRRIRVRPQWLVAPTALALVVGAVVATDRTPTEDLAGLGEAAASMPTGQGDGVLDVVVVADAAGRPVADDLVAAAAARDDLEVRVAEPFGCEAGADGAPATCEEHIAAWADLVAEADPDVVLFHVTRWDADVVGSLSGSDDPSARQDWVGDVLDRTFDALTTGGARVVVDEAGVDLAEGLERRSDPFYLALTELVASRPDVRTPALPGQDVDALLADLELYRRAGASGPRVLVVGDSVALTLGYGLERWATSSGAAVVWSAGTEGCGIADDGYLPDGSGREAAVAARCRAVAGVRAEQVAEFDPDLVIVLTGVHDLRDRRLEGGDDVLSPGDPALDDYLVAEWVDAYDALSAGGARVVWLSAPCAEDRIGLAGGELAKAIDPERVAHANEVLLPRLAEQRPDLRRFDLFSVLCPDGTFTASLGPVDDVRPDGVHLSPEGSQWLAEQHGADILAAGLDP